VKLSLNGGNVIWIDCEDTFKPRRIVEILMAREEITEEEAKKNLIILLIYIVQTQNNYLVQLMLYQKLMDKETTFSCT
jgi:hypothetical protein